MINHDELIQSSVHGSLATFAVTLAGLEAFGLKLLSAAALAAFSTTVSFFVQKAWGKKHGPANR